MPTVILSAVRTGVGTFGGTLRDVSATELGAIAARAAITRAGTAAGDVAHVIVGSVLQTSGDAAYLARHVALRAGCAIETPAVTVNRLCGSGFEALVQGARLIAAGEAACVLAGGTENMSQAPHVLRGLRWGVKYGAPPPLEDSLAVGLFDVFCGIGMGETAERLAERYGITREASDAYALRSQQAAHAAWQAGRFADELVPVPITDVRTRQTADWAADEHRRSETSAEALAKLKPAFRKDGIVTAGSASGINDGAAMLVLADEAWARARGLRPLARLVAHGVAGVPPEIMGIGPAPAIRQALDRAGLALDAVDLVEVNEAFAAQYLAVEQELGLDRARTNVDGGAIAIGHPLGASGARIATHLVHALRQRGLRTAVGSACIGGGQGIAVVLERTE
jgi:acetyl-CoA acetyltransferase family protein